MGLDNQIQAPSHLRLLNIKSACCVRNLQQMSPLADFFLVYAPSSLPHHLSSYVVGVTPLSTTSVVVSVMAGYLAVIFGIEAVMTHRHPYKLKRIFQIHNMFLSLSSALLLALILEEIVPQIWTYGIFHALCAVEAWTPVSLNCGPPNSDSHFSVEIGILLLAQLLPQICRAPGYRFSCFEEKTFA
jgi:hypothetical protein